MALEARFAALLSELASSDQPIDRIGEWFTEHEDQFRCGGGPSFHVRTIVQRSLAVCWSARQNQLSDEAARARLGALAEKLASPVE